MMLPPGGKPTMAGLPFKTPEQLEAERESYRHITAWLRWRKQRRYVGRDKDDRLTTIWAGSIVEIHNRYGDAITGVYEADDGKYAYTHTDWAVLLSEMWDSGQAGVDNSESPWYNLLNGEKGSNER